MKWRIVVAIALGFSALLSMMTPATAAAPANDLIEHATQVSALPFTEVIDVAELNDATVSPDDPLPCLWPRNTLWYAYTPPEDIVLRAHALATEFTVQVAAYTGQQPEMVALGCNAATAGEVMPPVKFFAQAGQTYYLMVAGVGDDPEPLTGELTFYLQQGVPPANDLPSNATVISQVPFSDTFDMIDATGAPDDPGFFYASVWYRYTPTTDQQMSVHVDNPYMFAQVYASESGELVPVGLGYSVAISAGTTYFIQAGAQVDLQDVVTMSDTAVPKLAVALTPDARQTVNPKTGVVIASGTLTCTTRAAYTLYVDVEQYVGRFRVAGSISWNGICDGPTRYEVAVIGDAGERFTAGKAGTTVRVFVADAFGQAASASVSTTINLVGKQ
jgi:hypothetical protein